MRYFFSFTTFVFLPKNGSKNNSPWRHRNGNHAPTCNGAVQEDASRASLFIVQGQAPNEDWCWWNGDLNWQQWSCDLTCKYAGAKSILGDPGECVGPNDCCECKQNPECVTLVCDYGQPVVWAISSSPMLFNPRRAPFNRNSWLSVIDERCCSTLVRERMTTGAYGGNNVWWWVGWLQWVYQQCIWRPPLT